MTAPVVTGPVVTGRSPRRLVLGAVGVVALLGWVQVAPFSVLGTANLALGYALIGVSLVILTGWVGQISLAQASFVGIGAFITGVVVRGTGLDFPATLPVAAFASAGSAVLLGVVALRVRGLFLAVATLIFAWMAQEYLFNQPWLAGVGGASSAPSTPLGEEGSFPFLDFTDRRTFYYVSLAALVATLLGAANLRDSKAGRAWFAVKGSEIAAASLGIAVTRSKLLAFAVSGFVAGLAGNLLMTHQQVATSSSFSPDVSLFYLAIAVVGGLGSLGGAVASAVLFASLEELFFRVDAFAGLLQIVSAVLLTLVLLFFPSGLAGLPAQVAASARHGFLAELGRELRRFARAERPVRGDGAEEVASTVSVEGSAAPPATGLPAGAPSGWAARRRAVAGTVGGVVDRLGRSLPSRQAHLPPAPDALAASLAGTTIDLARPSADDATSATGDTPDGASVNGSSPTGAAGAEAVAGEGPAVEIVRPGIAYRYGTATKPDLAPRAQLPLVLSASHVTVRFGGLTAVDDVTLEVRQGEIVGLIGPNGAGKTTLFNAISGLNEPTTGSVELFGHDITALEVHQRAGLGMGRTFQAIQLFPQLSVFNNLLVATHLRNDSSFTGNLLATETAVEEERTARERVRQVVALIGLEEVAARPVGGLPFGVLRLVEMARALVTGAPFVMLDEPASGLDSGETERFADLLLWVRQTLGVSLLLIEHDVRMVTSLSDYMYVIDRGKPLAEGTPQSVQRDPAVIAAYLGQAAGSDDADEHEPGAAEPDAEATGAVQVVAPDEDDTAVLTVSGRGRS